MGSAQTMTDSTQKLPKVYVGLVHSPVLNRKGEPVVTTITHFDIHDIARVCRTYGVQAYYLITRLEDQRAYVERVKDHWLVGGGSKVVAAREEALRWVKTSPSIEALQSEMREQGIRWVATSARSDSKISTISFSELREQMHSNSDGIFLVFGTGNGLAPGALDLCDVCLEPIRGTGAYNHLSVRSAVSICLDRLLATW